MARSYTSPFELRRLLVKWNRIPSGGVVEGPAICSFHFAKLTAAVVDANWLTADYAAVEARFNTWWTAQKVDHNVTLVLAEYRWYKSGPVFEPDDLAPGPSNPSVRATAANVPGTASGGMLPPQVAVTCTEVVEVRKRWGRFYLPAMNVSIMQSEGRINSPATTLARLVTLYNGIRADGFLPVVFTRGRSAYVTPFGASIAAHPATAYEVTDLQVDNLCDVQRSRRFSAPSVRSRTVLT